MNQQLTDLAAQVGLASTAREPLRLAFGLACARRVEHLLEDPRAIEALQTFRAFVEGRTDAAAFHQARLEIAEVARGHRGSNSIDGSAHAAVSATNALNQAMAGRALEAASYAAYASVYAYGGYAVNDPSAFEGEFAWQLGRLRELASAADRHEAPTSAVTG